MTKINVEELERQIIAMEYLTDIASKIEDPFVADGVIKLHCEIEKIERIRENDRNHAEFRKEKSQMLRKFK